jgi:hypothetical protein
MSFEILEYPIKQWIVSLIDDEKLKSDIFDLLGESDIDIRYPSVILYTIDGLIDHKEHNLVAKIEQIEKAADYTFDLKDFVKCKSIVNQLLSILKEADAVLKYIVNHTDKKFIELLDLDKLSVKLSNNLRLQLCYSGKDTIMQKKISEIYDYGFICTIVYESDSDTDSDNDSHNSEDELKQALDELSLDRA